MEIPNAPKVARGRAPVIECISTYQRSLPWQGRAKGLTEKSGTFHLVCLGVTDMRPLVERVLDAIAPGEPVDDEVLARQRGQGFLGTLLLDWRGRPVKGGLLPAPFVFATDRLANGKSLKGLEKEIAEKVEQISTQHFGVAAPALDEAPPRKRGLFSSGASDSGQYFDFEVHENAMDFGKLVGLGKGLASKLGVSLDTIAFRVMTRTAYRRRQGEITPPDFSEMVTPSFFINDLALVERTLKTEEMSRPLSLYLGEETPMEERVDLLTDHGAMAKAVAPNRLSFGRWPSNPEHPLCLAQQAAVGAAIDPSQPLVAVNGPPGTGKTTLLRDVIAHSVVLRAGRICQIEDPENIFSELRLSEGGSIPVIKAAVTAHTGIIVTSNNNSAVENISTELPRRAEIDAETFSGAEYLRGAADDVARAFGDQAPNSWGLLALRLGNKTNIDTTMKGLDQPWREEEEENPKPHGVYEHLMRRPALWDEWKTARKTFLELLGELDAAMKGRKKIAEGAMEAAEEDGYLVPDEAFFEKAFGERHLQSAWVTPELDKLRSSLFIEALRLHEIVLRLNASEIRRFFYPARRALTGQEKVSTDQLIRIWNTLFFISPVISTTLASVQRMPMRSGWIGHVLIDEAGQATPQSAVGILQRAKRATVVGDPLQIEPVMTVPVPVVERLRLKHGAERRFSPAFASTQTLADGTMKQGAWVDQGEEDEKVWTGIPLRVHRRCADPMFSISNRIAYDGQMVQAVLGSSGLLPDPGESRWIDVQGTTAVQKVVPEEMEILAGELTRLRDNWPQVGARPASVYVISPFVAVAAEAQQVARQVLGKDAWDLCPTGTVHRFQGREADIVYLVLGSQSGPKGERSRQWAALSPNILNVAVTRARSRLVVIGDVQSWSGQPYFSKLAQALPHYGL